jgi:hypothetical protein
MLRFARSTTLALVLTGSPSALSAQRAPAPRFVAAAERQPQRPLRGAVPDSTHFRPNAVTVAMGSGVLGAFGFVGGGALGLVVGVATARHSDDDMKGLLGVLVGATAGEVVGAGLGGYLGGGRQGKLLPDILIAGAVAAAGWIPVARRDAGWYVIPIAQVLSVTAVDRAFAAREKRRDLPSMRQDPFR